MAKPKPKYGVGGGVVSAKPTHGVGGGVVSRKPAARGGRSSVILGAPPIGASPLASYLKRKPGKRVK